MRPLFALLASASAVCAIAGVAVAAAPQADTIDLNVPTQLPRTAIPHHYAISITPHADALDVRRSGGDQPRGRKADKNLVSTRPI